MVFGAVAGAFLRLGPIVAQFSNSVSTGITRIGGVAAQAASGVSELANGFNEASEAAQRASAQVQTFLSTLVNANQIFENSLITSTGLFGGVVDFTDAVGKPLENVKAELLALRGPIKDIFLEFEQTALKLTGITSRDLSFAFNTASKNFADLQGQSSQFKNDFELVAKVAERFAVSSKALDLPFEQLEQEIRSFVTGDVTVDSRIATALGFTNAEIRKLKADGQLVDEFFRRTESLSAASGLGAETFAGAASNIEDFFQILARVSTEDIFKEITETTNDFFKVLNGNQGNIQDFGKTLVNGVGSI